MKHKRLEEMSTGKSKESMEVEKMGSTEYQKKFRMVWMSDVNFCDWLLPTSEPEKFEVRNFIIKKLDLSYLIFLFKLLVRFL